MKITIRRLLSALQKRPGFYGDYASFADAERDSIGYNSQEAIEWARKNTFPDGPMSHLDMQLLAALLFVRPKTVLDFGGALGGHYHRLNGFVRADKWTVVELPLAARSGIPDGTLSFSEEISSADVALASGSLQYVAEPYLMLQRLLRIAPYVIADRLPVLEEERITVQRVYPEFFPGSMPHWFLARNKLPKPIMAWRVPEHSIVLDGCLIRPFYGFLFSRYELP